MLTKTPWYVSYNDLFGRGFNGTWKGISVLEADIWPGLANSITSFTNKTG